MAMATASKALTMLRQRAHRYRHVAGKDHLVTLMADPAGLAWTACDSATKLTIRSSLWGVRHLLDVGDVGMHEG
ncbi:hypothetical protein [Rugosimonospora africana]|uniref:Uncharacterized protein n=1 Tax=Rugosimonospora africana TaxID=556532 RepID=A0A8J3R3B8_9ACTN|nr:hypothetical protein [Rugosimonospora africana]GIH19341.1 hypothetical protein Raf01_75130 [Rugosimonospora africana]